MTHHLLCSAVSVQSFRSRVATNRRLALQVKRFSPLAEFIKQRRGENQRG